MNKRITSPKNATNEYEKKLPLKKLNKIKPQMTDTYYLVTTTMWYSNGFREGSMGKDRRSKPLIQRFLFENFKDAHKYLEKAGEILMKHYGAREGELLEFEEFKKYIKNKEFENGYILRGSNGFIMELCQIN